MKIDLNKYKPALGKLGSILLTALISALIAWLQSLLIHATPLDIVTPSPELACGIGAILRTGILIKHGC